MLQMGKFLCSDRQDNLMQFRIEPFEETKLIVEMAVYSSFDRRRAGPYPVAAETGSQEPQHPSATAPQLHDPAWPRIARRHSGPKDRTVIPFVLQHLRQRRTAIRKEIPRDQELCGSKS